MSDTNPNNTPEHKMSGAERRELKEAFAAYQADQSKSGEFMDALRDALGLPEGTEGKAVLEAMPRTDAEKVVQRELEKERDDARAEVAKMKAERDAAKVNGELRKALEASGILPEFMDDAMMRANAVGFIVNDKGEVVTKSDAANALPSASPAAWVQGELKAKAARYWPTSQGGGVRGGGFTPNGLPGDTSCFNPASPNLTAQLRYEAQFGADAARRAAARYGVKLPGSGR